MRKIICIWIAVLMVFHSGVVSADYKICNHSCRNIWAAGGEQYFNDGRSWVSGWFFTPPGQCSTIIGGDVCYWVANIFGNCSDNLLAFAEDDNGHRWGGNLAICTTQAAFFDQPPQFPSNGSCPAGFNTEGWFQYPTPHPTDGSLVELDAECP